MQNNKLHAMIICALIGGVLIVWELMTMKPAAQLAPAAKSLYAIEIHRASYGLNCKGLYSGNADRLAGQSGEAGPYGDRKEGGNTLKENNVLETVKKICNGKARCDFIVEPKTFDFDPYPACSYKDLRIDFRCYNIDRLRALAGEEGNPISIDCNAIFKQ